MDRTNIRKVYQYTEIRVKIIVDYSVILKENYCNDARISYSHDSLGTIDSFQDSVNTERKKNRHNGRDLENDNTKHKMGLKNHYSKTVKLSHSSGKMEKKSSDNVKNCKTGEQYRDKRKERRENIPTHIITFGNAKNITKKTTMMGRSKEKGPTYYKKTGNSEEKSPPVLIKNFGNSKEKSPPVLIENVGNSEEKSSSSLIKTVEQTVKKQCPIPDPIKMFGHLEAKHVTTASNKVRHPKEYCMSTSYKRHLNSEVFNSLKTDRNCGYQTASRKTNNIIHYYRGHYCIDAPESDCFDKIQTFSGNNDTKDMMYHRNGLTSDSNYVYHEIKKKDLLTVTGSTNRSHVRSIQDVRHKIGICKDREEKIYDSLKSQRNKHSDCKPEDIFINNNTLLTKNLFSKLKNVFKNVTVTPKQQCDVYGDIQKHVADTRKVETEHCYDFDIKKVKTEPRDDFDVRKVKDELRYDFDVKKVKIEPYSTEHSIENFEIRKVKSEPLDLCDISDIKWRDPISIGSRKVKSEPSRLSAINNKAETESGEDTPLHVKHTDFDDLARDDNPNLNSNETEHQELENEIARDEYGDDNFIIIDEWYPENEDTEGKTEKGNQTNNCNVYEDVIIAIET